MADVTEILSRIEAGDPSAAEQLLPLVYDELRRLAAHRLAREKPGQTLQATALVHEAYLRLVDDESAKYWDSRGHFFAAAAESMRRILVDIARKKKSQKAGGGWQRLELYDDILPTITTPDRLVALDEALQKLAVGRRRCREARRTMYFRWLLGRGCWENPWLVPPNLLSQLDLRPSISSRAQLAAE